MFSTKNFLSIITDMIRHMAAGQKKITDFSVGSVNRVMLEATAAEVDELYQAMAQGLIEAIPTAIYRSFDFELIAAQYASGVLRFTVPANHATPSVIPVGTVSMSKAGVQYQTIEAITIPVGQSTGDVLAVSSTPGAAGNAPAGDINRPISSGVIISSVTNPLAFSNGRGKESEAERKIRFVEYIRTLARGTIASVIYAAKQATVLDPRTGTPVERVARVTVEETAGHVYLWLHNGTGNVSPALVQRADDLVQGYYDPDTGAPIAGYRPTGMRVDVAAMSELPVNVTIAIQAALTARTDALVGRIQDAISTTIRATRSGEALRPLDITNTALALAPYVMGAVIDSPTTTVPCPIRSVLVPGTITVNWI